MLNHIIFNGHNDDDDDYDSSTVYVHQQVLE